MMDSVMEDLSGSLQHEHPDIIHTITIQFWPCRVRSSLHTAPVIEKPPM